MFIPVICLYQVYLIHISLYIDECSCFIVNQIDRNVCVFVRQRKALKQQCGQQTSKFSVASIKTIRHTQPSIGSIPSPNITTCRAKIHLSPQLREPFLSHASYFDSNKKSICIKK
jgi:hypothetical protein